MYDIPFLRPKVVPFETYAPLLAEMDNRQIYSNNGPLLQRFEQALVDRLFDPGDHAVAVSNATVGLMIAMRAMAREGGKYAVMPSFTFAATPLAALWAGLIPFFVDVSAESWLTSEEQVGEAIDHLGPDLGVVVPYATFGAPMDLSFYHDLNRNQVPVVVDAAASLGSTVGARNFGAGCPFPVVFSMHATKSFPIGEGGVIITSDQSLADRIKQLTNFGFGAGRLAEEVGLNAKLSEMGAAVALATLDEFPGRVHRRQAIRDAYLESFSGSGGVDWSFQNGTGEVAPQFFSVLAPSGEVRGAALAQLNVDGIEARTYFAPACHEHPSFKGMPSLDLKITKELERRVVSLPLWEGMTAEQVDRIVSVVTRCL